MLIGCGIVNNNTYCINIATQRSFNFELVTWFKPELYIVTHCACDPALVGDASHGCEAQSRDAAYDLKNFGYDVNALDCGHVA